MVTPFCSQTKEMMQKHLEKKSKEGEEMRFVLPVLI